MKLSFFGKGGVINMTNKTLMLCLTGVLLSTALSPAQDSSQKKNSNETLVDQVNVDAFRETVVVSPDHRHVAYILNADRKQCVVVDGKRGNDTIASPHFR